MGNTIYSPVYMFNPNKEVIIEIDGEDYKNLTDESCRQIKHPIKFIGIEKDSKLRKRLDEVGRKEDNCFVSTPWGFFVKRPKGEERVGLSREREREMYEWFMDYFVTENFAVYDANARKMI